MKERTEDSNIYKALSTPVRRLVLNLIQTKGPIDLKSLTVEADMKETTLRHHLMVLERAGLVVSEEGREGVPGRPPMVYRVPNKHWDIAFPKRQYAMLAERLLGHMLDRDGRSAAITFMENMGRDSARHLLEDVYQRKGSKVLDIKDVQDFVVPALEVLGSAVQVTESSTCRICVKMNNCIFYELAAQYEDVVCKGHEAFFKAIAEALGDDYNVANEACLASGDDYCLSTIVKRNDSETE